MMDALWTPWPWGLFTGMARICEINLISGTRDPLTNCPMGHWRDTQGQKMGVIHKQPETAINYPPYGGLPRTKSKTESKTKAIM